MTLAEVYREHFRFVWRSLRRLGVPEADTQDAAQDVFLVVHRKLSDFEGRSRMTTWLFSICLHVARNRRRKVALRREVSDDTTLDAQEDPSADLEAAVRRREGLGLLEAILDEMDFDQRVVLSLFELDGMNGEAIAELLDVPLGTVYSRLRLGRESFHQLVARAQARERFAATRLASAASSRLDPHGSGQAGSP